MFLKELSAQQEMKLHLLLKLLFVAEKWHIGH